MLAQDSSCEEESTINTLPASNRIGFAISAYLFANHLPLIGGSRRHFSVMNASLLVIWRTIEQKNETLSAWSPNYLTDRAFSLCCCTESPGSCSGLVPNRTVVLHNQVASMTSPPRVYSLGRGPTLSLNHSPLLWIWCALPRPLSCLMVRSVPCRPAHSQRGQLWSSVRVGKLRTAFTCSLLRPVGSQVRLLNTVNSRAWSSNRNRSQEALTQIKSKVTRCHENRPNSNAWT